MIEISYKNEEGLIFERELTKEEENYTSKAFNGDTMICTFYYGDEPKIELSEQIEEKTIIPLTDEQLIAAFKKLKELGVI